MASKALSKTSHVVQYFPNLRAVVARTRTCMGTCMQLSTSSVGTASYQDKKLSEQWTENRLGPFANRDPRFPLPGNMGVVIDKEEKTTATMTTKSLVDALLEVPCDESHKMDVMGCFLDNMAQVEEHVEDQTEVQNEPEANLKQIVGTVECSVQACPTFLHRGFMDLFPEKNLKPNHLTIINISQFTENDMSRWSMEVEDEREAFMENFVESAKEICANLACAGYWADFVDPSSGTAFFGPHTNTTLFETDDRFNHLGFNILDLGCCKVISHHLWGTHVFVGSIFTDAPTDCEILTKSLQQQ